MSGDHVGAAFHLDRYLPFIEEVIPSDAWETVYSQAVTIYGDVKDLPGLLFLTRCVCAGQAHGAAS
jgi:hypothetical protein